MEKSFIELEIKDELIKGLKNQNINKPTLIQQLSIPDILQNKDVLVQSETGTGKTLAYLLPLFTNINCEGRFTQAVVLAPTHELASQINKQCELLAKNSGLNIRTALIIGGSNIHRQLDKLKEKPQVIVGSSGRVLELINKRKISAHTVKSIVVDEADRMLDNLNKDNVFEIIKSTLRDRQLIMVSATFKKETEKIAYEIMKQPQLIRTNNKNSLPDTISHIYFNCEQREKVDILKKLIHLFGQSKALVFLNNKNSIEALAKRLNYHNIKAAAIFGESLKNDRRIAIEDIKTGRVQVLVTSDLAARGLDINGIDVVISLDVPEEPNFYLHRAGRCGRAGNEGCSIIIASSKNEIYSIKKYEKEFNIKVVPKQLRYGKIVEV